MNLRRALAVAVAAAVTTPAAFAVAAPAYASTSSVVRAAEQPTYEELKQAAADAKRAYDEALAAKDEAYQGVLDVQEDDWPLNVAQEKAAEAAKDAADAKTAAEQKVTEAKAALDKAETDAEKAEAQKALDEAESALTKATEAKTKADQAAEAARKAFGDGQVAAFRALHVAEEALKAAEQAKKEAEAALKAAGEGVRENGLTSQAIGLPSKVVAGTQFEFTVRITNGTERTLSLETLVLVSATKYKDNPVTVEWFDGSDWHVLGMGTQYVDRIAPLKPGAANDLKLRVEFDAKSKGGDAIALVAAVASDPYNPYIHGPMKRYDFEVLPEGSDPGEPDDAKPGKPGEADDPRPGADGSDDGKGGKDEDAGKDTGNGDGTSPQGETDAAADGSLASTGASTSPTSIALGSAGALTLGAAAVYFARRRKATATATGSMGD